MGEAILHFGSFALYNAIIGYLTIQRAGLAAGTLLFTAGRRQGNIVGLSPGGSDNLAPASRVGFFHGFRFLAHEGG